MRIVLQEDTELLDEVVVVGYGTQKKVNLTEAVASVDVGKALSAHPIADVGRGLQGTTPGLSVVVLNGEVGIDPRIKIRLCPLSGLSGRRAISRVALLL